MKRLVLFTLIAVTAAVDYYKVKDDLDADAIVANGSLKTYIDCFLDKGPCTDVATDLKATIKESIQQGCARCTDNLKYLYWRFLKEMSELFPESYVEYRQRYDPENKYIDAFFEVVSKYKKPNE